MFASYDQTFDLILPITTACTILKYGRYHTMKSP